MAQEEILKFLIRKKGQFIPLPELCIALAHKANRSNISKAARKLKERNEIKVKMVKEGPFTKWMVAAK